MAEGHRDYSGTPLWKKLGIAAGSRVWITGAPDGALDLQTDLAPLPPAVEFLGRAGKELDVAVIVAARFSQLERGFAVALPRMTPAGRLWVAWPKKASGAPTDITFETAQGLGLAAGLVDNKTAAVSAVYQGLQFVRRKADRLG